MKRAVLYIICAALVLGGISSCSKKGDIIPRTTMSKIYAELFVADSWLSMASPEDRYMADTMAFYEPVFKEFGYTTSDYLASVEYYLNDPERFARILKKTQTMLESELNLLDERVKQERDEENAERERKARLDRLDAPCIVYKDFVHEAFFTDYVRMERDENGVYVPSSNQEEKSFRGPGVIFKSDSLKLEPSSKPVVVQGGLKRKILLK